MARLAIEHQANECVVFLNLGDIGGFNAGAELFGKEFGIMHADLKAQQ